MVSMFPFDGFGSVGQDLALYVQTHSFETEVNDAIAEYELTSQNTLKNDVNQSALKRDLSLYKEIFMKKIGELRKIGCSSAAFAETTKGILADLGALYQTAVDRDAKWCEYAEKYKVILHQPVASETEHEKLSAPPKTEAPSLLTRISNAATQLGKKMTERPEEGGGQLV